MGLLSQRTERVVNNKGVFNAFSDSSWPETFSQTVTHRKDQGSVGMQDKEAFQTVNIYWGNNFKEVRVIPDCSEGYGVGEFIHRGRWKRRCAFSPCHKCHADRIIISPDKVSNIMRPIYPAINAGYFPVCIPHLCVHYSGTLGSSEQSCSLWLCLGTIPHSISYRPLCACFPLHWRLHGCAYLSLLAWHHLPLHSESRGHEGQRIGYSW